MTGYRSIDSTNLDGDTAAYRDGQAVSFGGSTRRTLGFYGGDLGSHAPTEGRVPAFLGLAERHGGTYIENPPSVADALKQTGLDFEVRHAPITATRMADVLDDGEMVSRPTDEHLDMGGWVATVAYPRDGGQPFALAPTRPSYSIIQPEDVLSVGDEISEGRLVALGAYGKPRGAKVYAAYELGDGMEIAGDAYRNFLTIIASFDRSASNQYLLAPIRLGCTNQTTATFGRAVPRFKVRHTGNAEVKVEEARRALGLSKKYLEVFAQKSEELLTIKMTKDTFVAFEHEVFGVKDDAEGRALTLSKARDEQLLGILSSQTCDFGKGTAYAGVQALVEYADFFAPVRGKDGDVLRAERVLDGRADSLKQKAYDLAFALA